MAKLEWARLACFVVFAALAIRARPRGRIVTGDPARRPRVDLLLTYALAVSFATGFAQRESWPFTHWALVHHLCPRDVKHWFEIEAVDRAGHTYIPDPVVWQPLALEELQTWIGYHFEALDPRGRDRVASFLLARAEGARRRLVHGESIDRNAAWLGPLAAPYHFQRARTWISAADVPAEPFARIRIVDRAWNVAARAHDESRVTGRIVYESDGTAHAAE